MPSNFAQYLPTSGPASTIPQEQSGRDIALTGEVIAGAVAAITDYRKQKVLGELVIQAQEVVSESTQFEKFRNSLVEKAYGADKLTLDGVADDMRRLRNGEIQGVISPFEANVQLQNLARTYIGRYPRMALEIRQLLSAVSGGIIPEGKTGDISDPILKEKAELLEEATGRGTSVPDVIALRQEEARKMSVQARLDIATSEGAISAPKLMLELVDATSSHLMSEISSGMMVRIKQGRFVKENEIAALQEIKAKSLIELERALTEKEIDSGHIVNHQQFVDRFSRPLDVLITMSGQVDSKEKEARLAAAMSTILTTQDYAYLHNVFGGMTGLALSRPEEMLRILEGQAEMVQNIKSGQLESIELAAKYSIKTRLLLDSLKFNGEGWEALMDHIGDVNTRNKPVEPLPTAMQELANAINLNIRQGTPEAEAGEVIANHLLSEQPITPIASSPRLRKVVANNPVAQQAVDQMVTKHMTSYINTVPLEELAKIEINASNVNRPLTYTGEQLVDVSGQSVGSTLNRGILERGAVRGNPFVNQFNDFASVMSEYKTPKEIQSEVTALFSTLISDRIKRDMDAVQGIMMKADPHVSGRPKQEEETETVTDVDEKGQVSGARFEYDEENDLIIDRQLNRIISPAHVWTPKEIEDLKASGLGALAPAE